MVDAYLKATPLEGERYLKKNRRNQGYRKKEKVLVLSTKFDFFLFLL